MKKILFISTFILVAVAVVFATGFYKSEYIPVAVVGAERSDILPPHNGNVAITIYAIGDCTLGSDLSFGSAGTFDAVYEEMNGDCTYFLSMVEPYIARDHLTIANLEGPLSDGGIRAQKQFSFRGKPEYVNILTSSSVEAVNLANNHTADYGDKALDDTRNVMKEMGINAFGMSDFSIVDVKGIKVGLVGTNALEYTGRVNFNKVFKELKGCNPDLIIASFHWGVEKADVPTADQITLARSAIDNGADLVLGHHPHVLQGVERYKGKYIVYSLGNFCFGGNKSPADTDTMIFRQTFHFKNGQLVPDKEKVSIIPCAITSVKGRNNYQPVPLRGKEFERVKEKIINRSSGFDGIESIEFTEMVR